MDPLTDSPVASPLVHLEDGTAVLLRLFVPSDREAVQEAFRRLSRDSRYYRFWSRQESVPDSLLNSFLNAEPGLHETWAAQDPLKPDEPGMGGGSFWRSKTDSSAAEISFTVADECQHQGVGTLLLAVLWLRAELSGIREFHGYALSDNYAVLDWFRALGAAPKLEHGHFHFVLALDRARLKPTPTASKLCAWLEQLRPAFRAAESAS